MMENYETNFNVLMPIIFAIFCHEYGLFVHINDLQNFKLNLYTPIVCKMQKAKPVTIRPLLPGLVLLVSLEARRHTHAYKKYSDTFSCQFRETWSRLVVRETFFTPFPIPVPHRDHW